MTFLLECAVWGGRPPQCRASTRHQFTVGGTSPTNNLQILLNNYCSKNSQKYPQNLPKLEVPSTVGSTSTSNNLQKYLSAGQILLKNISSTYKKYIPNPCSNLISSSHSVGGTSLTKNLQRYCRLITCQKNL